MRVTPSVTNNHQVMMHVQVINAEGKLLSLQKSGLKELEIMKGSPMPGYKEKLTSQELADAVSYLASLKGAR